VSYGINFDLYVMTKTKFIDWQNPTEHSTNKSKKSLDHTLDI